MPWRLQYLPEEASYIPLKDIDITDDELTAIKVALSNAAQISTRGEESSFYIAHRKIVKREEELGIVYE